MIEKFVPGAGGAENVAWRVAHELARRGDAVTVLAREFPGETDDPNSHTPPPSTDVQFARIAAPRFWQPLRVAAFSRGVRRRIGQVDPRSPAPHAFDVVHSFARTRHQDLYRAGGGSHADYLARNHEGLARSVRQLSPRHRVLLRLEGGVFRDRRQRIQCASRLVADRLVDEHGVNRDRILLLPNAVDAERFSNPEAIREGMALRTSLGGNADQIWLLPGSGWRRKGLTTALDALALLKHRGHHLWVAGRDDPRPWQKKAQERGIGDRVRFLGERSDLPALYHAVDGMVLPTRYDPFANVTLEAAAAGLPIVTSAANGAAEWLGQDIRIVPQAADANAFAHSIDHFQSLETRRRTGRAAQERARRLDWAQHVASLQNEYRNIIESRRRQEDKSR